MKQEKHNAIKLFAPTKLDSMADIISQAMQDRDISSNEFHKVLQEVERYRKLKSNAKPRYNKLLKNNEKNYMKKEEKKARKFFYGKPQILQISRVSVPFKI